MTVPSQSGGEEIALRMRAEWDRRIAHDYRYWMSDGVQSDAEMWAVGERDFEILCPHESSYDPRSLTALEVGCGVGRILRAAALRFANVIGVDVSSEAITRAQRLLSDLKNVELILGNGTDLRPVADMSVDFVYSFAALSSMPVSAIAAYLIDISRVLRKSGRVVLQVYLGRPQDTAAQDTIAIRSFERGRFIAAVQEAGFSVQSVKPLILPFEVSDPEAGLHAEIVNLVKQGPPRLPRGELQELLLPGGEPGNAESWQGSRTECLMALVRARQLIDQGDRAGAERAIAFARDCYQGNDEAARSLLAEIESRMSGPNTAADTEPALFVDRTASVSQFDYTVFDENVQALSRLNPGLARQLRLCTVTRQYEIRQAENGDPVIIDQSLALDQVEKPRRAGAVWAERALQERALEKSDLLIVFGFAGGYHLEGLCECSEKKLFVVEPCLEILKTSLGLRDLKPVFARLAGISADLTETESLTGEATAVHVLHHPQSTAHSRDVFDELRRRYTARRAEEELRPAFAVVGPIYGGSLPIAGYTARALQRLYRRVHNFDLGAFHQAYRELGAFLRDGRRRSVLQSYYVEMLSQLVLEALTENPVDILICLAQAPMSPRVLTELRKRGVVTVMWFVEDYRRFTAWRDISRYFDYMFMIQRGEALQRVEEAGAGKAVYLPVACDPNVHCPMALSAEEKQRWGSQVSFVGAGYNNRQQMFASLARHDFKIWGTEWPTVPPFNRLVQEQGRRLTPEEYIKIFNASVVNLNLHSSMERDGVEPNGDFVNPRTFELAACGAFQLTDNRLLLPELFAVPGEIATFDTRREMQEQIDYYLAHPAERERIAQAARTRVLNEHTYEHRIRQMVSHVLADRYEYLKQRCEQGPWPRTLEAASRFPELRKRFDEIYEAGGDPKLETLVARIQLGKGSLTETEQRLLFLHHIKGQIAYVNELREGKKE